MTKTRLRPVLLALGLALASSAAAAPKTKDKDAEKKPAGKPGERVKLKLEVVDVSDGRAYLSPGSEAGLRVGDDVRFGKDEYEVITVTESFAVVLMGEHTLAVGDKGAATVELGREEAHVDHIATPPGLSTFRGAWSEPRRPAEDQHPDPVPLGLIEEQGSNRVRLSAYGYGVVPTAGKGTGVGRVELRGVLHVEPFVGTPFAIDVDVAAEAYVAPNLDDRRASDARPPIRVRRLELAYGRDRSWFGSVGRLRYASSFLGTLDGVKVRAPITDDLSLSAFGGLVPEPLNGLPSGTSRFGGEVAYEDLEAGVRPRVVVGGHASRFEGQTDERRVDASVDLLPDFGRLGVSSELAFFDKNNPWQAETTELSSLQGDASVRAGVVEVSARGGLMRPERSLWLASFLPPEWLCVANPTATGASVCAGNDATYSAAGDIGLRFTKTSAQVGAHYISTPEADAQTVGAFSHLRLIDLVGTLRLDAGVTANQSDLLRNVAASLSPGVEVLERSLDLSARYRVAYSRYRAADAAFLEHWLGVAIWYSPSREVDVALDADTVFGSDVDILVLQGLVTWRPSL
ncbi:MAG: hypothetical protein R3B13_34575 [Polyangiaceae bacterium]